MSRWTLTFLCVVAAVLGGGSTQAAAQSVSQQEEASAILSELRQIREDLNRVSRASLRMQLLVGRLALQEQRTQNVVRELSDVHAALVAAQSEHANAYEALAKFEAAVSGGVPGDQAKFVEVERSEFLASYTASSKRVKDLTARETELQQRLRGEQDRWSGLSAQLDQLERDLADPAR